MSPPGQCASGTRRRSELRTGAGTIGPAAPRWRSEGPRASAVPGAKSSWCSSRRLPRQVTWTEKAEVRAPAPAAGARGRGFVHAGVDQVGGHRLGDVPKPVELSLAPLHAGDFARGGARGLADHHLAPRGNG